MNTQYKQLVQKDRGFTIIEVVLVLAIAGLIFLMVFLALPALQRGQRDTQRKDDLSRAQTALTSYQSNNKGSLPGSLAADYATFLTSYLTVGGSTFTDPSGKPYIFDRSAAASNTTVSGVDATDSAQTSVRIYVAPGAKCDGESIVTGQGARKVALRIPLEGGGVACVNN